MNVSRIRWVRLSLGTAVCIWGGCRANRVSPATGPARMDLPVCRMTLGQETFEVQIAATPPSRQRGLMGRRALDKNAGMLFVFPDEAERHFWMKNTLIPLDIAFARADGRIVTIRTMRPRSEELYGSAEPCRYALEVPAGTFARLDLREGDQLSIPAKVRAMTGR